MYENPPISRLGIYIVKVPRLSSFELVIDSEIQAYLIECQSRVKDADGRTGLGTHTRSEVGY